MKKERLLIFIIAILVLLNITVIGLQFFRHRGPEAGREIGRMIERKLDLNPQQREQYHDMMDRHHEQMQEIDMQMKAPFEEYFALLQNQETDTIKKDSLQGIITGFYNRKLTVTYNHFEELKSICNPEQKQKFNTIVPQLLHVIAPPPPGEK